MPSGESYEKLYVPKDFGKALNKRKVALRDDADAFDRKGKDSYYRIKDILREYVPVMFDISRYEEQYLIAGSIVILRDITKTIEFISGTSKGLEEILAFFGFKLKETRPLQ